MQPYSSPEVPEYPSKYVCAKLRRQVRQISIHFVQMRSPWPMRTHFIIIILRISLLRLMCALWNAAKHTACLIFSAPCTLLLHYDINFFQEGAHSFTYTHARWADSGASTERKIALLSGVPLCGARSLTISRDELEREQRGYVKHLAITIWPDRRMDVCDADCVYLRSRCAIIASSRRKRPLIASHDKIDILAW